MTLNRSQYHRIRNALLPPETYARPSDRWDLLGKPAKGSSLLGGYSTAVRGGFFVTMTEWTILWVLDESIMLPKTGIGLLKSIVTVTRFHGPKQEIR